VKKREKGVKKIADRGDRGVIAVSLKKRLDHYQTHEK